MEIVRNPKDNHLELVVTGRLDGYWAQHLQTSVGEVMREGTHSVQLNLAGVAYISSAGIGVLVEIYKSFQAVQGSFVVTEPSRTVRNVLQMVGLTAMLTAGAPASQGSSAAAAAAPAPVKQIERREAGGAIFEIHEYTPGARMACRLLGRPELLGSAGFAAADCRGVTVKDDRIALGLGSFGEAFENCHDRFGEFLAVAGGAACQPTDGANFPDYMLSSGSFVPRMSALYGLCCDGGFSKLVRFESASGHDPVALSLIVETCLEIAGATTAGVVVLAESAGLMGAALKRSPVNGGADGKADGKKAARLFGYPEIRQWLSFSPERCFARALTLIAGVASSSPPAELQPFVRPMAKRSKLAGHFHAAAFGYRPLQKGKVELGPAVRNVFEAGGLQGVLHVLADDRDAAGGGESELLRGACWIGPIGDVSLAASPGGDNEEGL